MISNGNYNNFRNANYNLAPNNSSKDILPTLYQDYVWSKRINLLLNESINLTENLKFVWKWPSHKNYCKKMDIFSLVIFLSTISAYEGSTEIVLDAEKSENSEKSENFKKRSWASAIDGWSKIENSRGTQADEVTEKTKPGCKNFLNFFFRLIFFSFCDSFKATNDQLPADEVW